MDVIKNRAFSIIAFGRIYRDNTSMVESFILDGALVFKKNYQDMAIAVSCIIDPFLANYFGSTDEYEYGST